eukprot:6352595-Alexandrium_andersonii.AAC.1
MSASLVGSEMCIRDSACRSALDAGRQKPLLLEALGGGRGPRIPNGVRSVSYTHLTLPTICSV